MNTFAEKFSTMKNTDQTLRRINLPRLAVMPCPDYAGEHPFHDQRWLITEGTTTERGYDPRPGEWTVRGGSLVAKMRDCLPGTASEIAHRCNCHDELVAALEGIAALASCCPHDQPEACDRELEKIMRRARAALSRAKGC